MTTPTPALETVTTADLKVGDVVHTFGMRLLIDAPPQIRASADGGTSYLDTEIANFDQLIALAETDPSSAGLIVSTCRDGRYPIVAQPTKSWQREIRE